MDAAEQEDMPAAVRQAGQRRGKDLQFLVETGDFRGVGSI